LGILLMLMGCGPVPRNTPRPSGVSLEDAFRVQAADGRVLDGEAGHPSRFSLVRAGVRRSGLLLVAPIAVSAPLTGLVGKMVFRCLVAPVYNIGDGTILEIVLFEAEGNRMLMRRRVDPGRRSEDRQWIPLAVPFEISHGDASLLIRVSGGDSEKGAGAGVDLVADWLVVADPRLTAERSEK
jgi:hypothetical protein